MAHQALTLPLTQVPDDEAALRLRDPAVVMDPRRMSAVSASRLSFTRSLVRRMAQERWRFERARFELDAEGKGLIVYRIRTAERDLRFAIFSDHQPPESHREGATARSWDAVGFMADGEITDERLARIRPELPNKDLSLPTRYLMGRADPWTIGFTRGMRSGRAFDHVVERLAAGRQPDLHLLAETGYIIRNRGFFGNGRHGTSLYEGWPPTHPLYVTHHAQALALFVWRQYGLDLAHHLARARNPRAAELDPQIARFLGVGNQSGMGLIRFMMHHPRLTHTLSYLREVAIARVRLERPAPSGPEARRLLELHDRAIAFLKDSHGRLDPDFTPPATIASELGQTRALVAELIGHGTIDGRVAEHPWAALCCWAERLDVETQEFLHALLIELYPDLAHSLAMRMNVDESTDVVPQMRLGDLRDLLRHNYAWAFDVDTRARGAYHYYYYLSELNREPRFGPRAAEHGANHPEYLDIPGDIQRLDADLVGQSPATTVAAFLARHPSHRFWVERVQSLADCPYAELRANIFAASFKPILLVRFLKSWFGVERSEVFGVRWIRGTLLQGAPTADDVERGVEAEWSSPYPLVNIS